MPTPMLNAVPNVNAMLAAIVVVRFQKMPNRKTAAIGGAINPSTDWNTLNRFNPLILSMAMVMITEISAPVAGIKKLLLKVMTLPNRLNSISIRHRLTSHTLLN